MGMADRSTASQRHPYLSGNFAPVKRELALTSCVVVHGSVPEELRGGQYVRNGGNPLKDNDEQREAHWFDGDGMLTGVLFQDDPQGAAQPHFINRYILTDVLLSTAHSQHRPFLPSIATFAAPFTVFSLLSLLAQIMRTVLLSLLSWLPFQPTPSLKRISAANTSIWWHDGQAFAGCESGPPIRILLPGLETAEWWTGQDEEAEKTQGWRQGMGPLKMLNEFTTAHPRIDPITNELLLFHMSFAPPYLRVSVIPPRRRSSSAGGGAPDSVESKAMFGATVPGLSKAKLAHDFCASSKRTVLIDLPLVLDPRNLLHGKPMLSYEADTPTRFGIFPRRRPDKVKWYESEGCCIYHAANAWDEGSGEEETTNVVACRLNSATLVYAAGNLDTPAHARPKASEEKCQLYYWRFGNVPQDVEGPAGMSERATVLQEFALSDVPVEFPTMHDACSQRANRFVYGASMTSGSFDAGLGSRSAKIDCLAKFDIQTLIARGQRATDDGVLQKGKAVDQRSVQDILTAQRLRREDDPEDAIQLFALPPHHYAQEATFIARHDARREDDGFLVFFVFDESHGLDHDGQCRSLARSQLWVLDARTMTNVVCKVDLPQRVPYGLHGHFFSATEIGSQRPVDAGMVRNWALARAGLAGVGLGGSKAGVQSGDRPKNDLLRVFVMLASAGVDALRTSIEHVLG